jgi:hypothetical protein
MRFSSSHRHSRDMEALKEERPLCMHCLKGNDGSSRNGALGPHNTCMPCSIRCAGTLTVVGNACGAVTADSPGPLSGVQCCRCRIFMWMRGSKVSPPLEPCLSFQKWSQSERSGVPTSHLDITLPEELEHLLAGTGFVPVQCSIVPGFTSLKPCWRSLLLC